MFLGLLAEDALRLARRIPSRERIRRRTYSTREEAKADVFDYIECFYNRRRRHGYLDYVSPVAFENQTMRT